VFDADTKKTFVFVPGAWLGGWSWNPVARLLHQDGNQVVALTLPGLSYGSSPTGLRLSDAVNFVANEIEARNLANVILVCHSWGGYPATGAAHKSAKRISKVVYYNAVVPEQGQSMADENKEYGQAIHEAVATRPDGTVPIPFEAFRAGLMPDEPISLAEIIYSMTLPQPGGYMTDSLDTPAVTKTGLDAGYILGAGDISLARPGAEFAARLGVEPLIVPGSHMTLLSRPQVIADALTALT
jgi:pimeloyl-ACP methyl ester carboxylesterase